MNGGWGPATSQSHDCQRSRLEADGRDAYSYKYGRTLTDLRIYGSACRDRAEGVRRQSLAMGAAVVEVLAWAWATQARCVSCERCEWDKRKAGGQQPNWKPLPHPRRRRQGRVFFSSRARPFRVSHDASQSASHTHTQREQPWNRMEKPCNEGSQRWAGRARRGRPDETRPSTTAPVA